VVRGQRTRECIALGIRDSRHRLTATADVGYPTMARDLSACTGEVTWMIDRPVTNGTLMLNDTTGTLYLP
jgi:hypothetical protein